MLVAMHRWLSFPVLAAVVGVSVVTGTKLQVSTTNRLRPYVPNQEQQQQQVLSPALPPPLPPAVEQEQPMLEEQGDTGTSRFLTAQTQKFAVNGTGIPEVHFDVGESYAGSLPISTTNANDSNRLFFWFFPSENKTVDKEITIWLTGGPGCSSIGELMSENGPFLWQPGVFRPVQNKWSWHRLTNMVWIDQPIGSGFAQGTVTARNEHDVAAQFLGFWRNFVDTFGLQGYKVYITGSSYSGMYCPYIASAMLDTQDPRYHDVRGMQVFDGVYSNFPVQQDIPASRFATSQWRDTFGFNDSFTADIRKRSAACGYEAYLDRYITFPARERQSAKLPGVQTDDETTYTAGCSIWNDVYSAAQEVNPCFSLYTVTNLCPMKYDPLGFADGTMYMPEGAGPAYFNRPDVKAAIHAPAEVDWQFCTNGNVFVDGTDTSVVDGPGSQPVLPGVIDRTQNVILGHGSQDFVLIADGTLLSIQNMSWGGVDHGDGGRGQGRRMGFATRPSAPLYIPYHDNGDFATAAGAGVMGTAHTERGLTYLAVEPAGHFLAMNAPAVAFRSMEVLLGRVEGFQSTAPFTTDANRTAQSGNIDMVNGTVMIGNGGIVTMGGGDGGGGGGGGTAEGNSDDTTMTATTAAISQAPPANGGGNERVAVSIAVSIFMISMGTWLGL